jgi:uncharacterized protein (TIGR02145 family)
MDRNLGASRVAISSTDERSYGDYYQWGRLADGHEKVNSGVINKLSNTDVPGHDLFIIYSPLDLSNGADWRLNHNNIFWQGVNSLNNVCPNGFRLPTQEEWQAEIKTWNSPFINGSFNSPLKLPSGGMRSGNFGDIVMSYLGFYWTSSVIPGSATSKGILISDGGASAGEFSRISGLCVRCIRD